MLREGGRLVVISFQFKEDRIVKEYLSSCTKNSSSETKMVSNLPRMVQDDALTQFQPSFYFVSQILQPKDDELESNPRSRSAKLRCVERTRHPPMGFPIDPDTFMIDWNHSRYS
eukprot:TRINITY_DN1442_c0_g1_i24.p2 TRINITY_DN1442_c0_g1~~TRINITY_DN1442_c0_g1_i24.p2  ORF type:complete len:114 (-),score=14.97 TRINITY_DN1442_c0_g1_i24:207-548(-)